MPKSSIAAEPSVRSVLDQLTQEPDDQRAVFVTTPALSPEARPIASGRLAALAARCAPATPVNVILALVAVESAGRPLLIAQNGPVRRVYTSSSRLEADERLDKLVGSGANLDIGLMQINSSTLQRLHVPAHEALDSCRNLEIGARIFDASYAAAFARRGPTISLMSAYSAYNTGNAIRGFSNGYVDKVSARLRTSGARSESE